MRINLPGVILAQIGSSSLGMLYWHITYLLEATKPAILEDIFLMRGVRCGCLGVEDLIRTASVDITVAIACRPAARIVSPDSTRSTVKAR